jgi:hypothetical protein
MRHNIIGTEIQGDEMVENTPYTSVAGIEDF